MLPFWVDVPLWHCTQKLTSGKKDTHTHTDTKQKFSSLSFRRTLVVDEVQVGKIFHTFEIH